jgi:hypothetical protein
MEIGWSWECFLMLFEGKIGFFAYIRLHRVRILEIIRDVFYFEIRSDYEI